MTSTAQLMIAGGMICVEVMRIVMTIMMTVDDDFDDCDGYYDDFDIVYDCWRNDMC